MTTNADYAIHKSARAHTDRSIRVFRYWLNERQFPLAPPKPAGTPPAKTPPITRGQLRVRLLEEYAALSLIDDLTAPQKARRNRIERIVAGMVNVRPGSPEWDAPVPRYQPQSAKPKPSQHRPESANVVWRTWLADPNRQLIVVNKPATRVTRFTDNGDEYTEAVRVDEFWITMVEELRLPHATDQQLAYLNTHYLASGVPLTFRGKYGWRVYEPIEAVAGPFSHIDDAEQYAMGWKSELDDDWHDFGAGQDVSPLYVEA